MTQDSNTRDFPKELTDLISNGLKEGKLTTSEIAEGMLQVDLTVDQVDELFALLSDMHIEITDEVVSGIEQRPVETEKAPVAEKWVRGVPTSESIYQKEMHSVVLLSSEEEREFGRIIQAGKIASDRVAANLDLSMRERYRLKSLAQEALVARNRLVESNLRLAAAISRHYRGRGLDPMDLIQEANIGLMRAAERYDPTRGFRFSTYGTWWIRQAITRAIADQSRTIRIPVHRFDLINKYLRTKRQLTDELGRDPLPEEIADVMETTPASIKELMTQVETPISLDTTIRISRHDVSSEDETLDPFLGDNIVDLSSLPQDAVVRYTLQQNIDSTLDNLKPREKLIIEMRFGLNGEESHTLEAVGHRLGVTRERVRQIENRALQKLLKLSKKNGLHEYLEE